MAKYKVRHALASWTNTDGTPGTAFRGQVAEIPDSEAKRLKVHFALIGPDEEVEHPGILQDIPSSPSDEELLNWIANANPSEVRALIAKRPELTPRIEGTLLSVKSLRAQEDTHYNDIRLAIQQGGLKPDDPTGILGSAGATGRDVADTSGDDDNGDIILATGDKGSASIAPVDSSGGVQGPEANTELKDANGIPDGGQTLPPVDHSVLVEGSEQDVANFIAAHPEQAADILEAETVHSEGSPRTGIVNAVRAATGFTN